MGDPRFVGSVGHIRVYAALASLASTAALLHAVVDSPIVWLVLRIISGFSQAGLYIVAESWLNDSATNENRGRLLSIYMIVIMGGLGLGQLLLSVADPGAATLFIVSSVLVSLAVVPVTLSVGKAPDFHWTARLPVRKIWEAAPAGVIGGFGAGFANGAIIALGAVYGTETGMSVDRIAVFMGLLVIGAVVIQWPVGVVSDRMRRRRAILLITLLAAALAALGAVVDPLGSGMLVVIFVFGGTTFPLYSLSLSHINDHAPPGSAIAVSVSSSRSADGLTRRSPPVIDGTSICSAPIPMV